MIDPATNKVVDEIQGIEIPSGVAFSPDGKRLYFSCEGEKTLDFVERESKKIIGKVPLTGLSAIEPRSVGLPQAIRSDNGIPFASPHGLFQLSRLSVWWLRLGISIERIRPGHPQQNGRHERMHLALKKEATRPAGRNILQQQAKFDHFVEEFNRERPHEALGMQCPIEVYNASPRRYQGIPSPTIRSMTEQ